MRKTHFFSVQEITQLIKFCFGLCVIELDGGIRSYRKAFSTSVRRDNLNDGE